MSEERPEGRKGLALGAVPPSFTGGSVNVLAPSTWSSHWPGAPGSETVIARQKGQEKGRKKGQGGASVFN